MCFSVEVVDNYICTTRMIHDGAIVGIDLFLQSPLFKILLLFSEVFEKFMKPVKILTCVSMEVSSNF